MASFILSSSALVCGLVCALGCALAFSWAGRAAPKAKQAQTVRAGRIRGVNGGTTVHGLLPSGIGEQVAARPGRGSHRLRTLEAKLEVRRAATHSTEDQGWRYAARKSGPR